MGAIGIVCPLVVAAFAEGYLDPWAVKVVSLSGAAAVAIFAAFEVGAVTNRFRAAWKGLNAAIIEYQSGLTEIASVVAAYRAGEDLIGALKPSPFQRSSDN